MKDKVAPRPLVLWLLIVLQFLLGLGAIVGGGVFILAPDGHLMQIPLDLLKGTPFSDYLVPGILLFTFVGFYPLVVAYSLLVQPSWSWPNVLNPFKGSHWAWAASLAAGVDVLIWIVAQMVMLNAVAFLHILYMGWGITIIILTLHPNVRRSLAR